MEIHHHGQENVNADLLSRSPVSSAVSDDSDATMVMQVRSGTVSDLLEVTPDALLPVQPDVLASEQCKDLKLQAMIRYLTEKKMDMPSQLVHTH